MCGQLNGPLLLMVMTFYQLVQFFSISYLPQFVKTHIVVASSVCSVINFGRSVKTTVTSRHHNHSNMCLVSMSAVKYYIIYTKTTKRGHKNNQTTPEGRLQKISLPLRIDLSIGRTTWQTCLLQSMHTGY